MSTRSPLRIPSAAIGVMVTLVSWSCAGAGDGGGGDGPAGLEGPDYTIDPRPADVFMVGALEGESWETFGNVTRVAFDADGNLFILDTGAGHIVMMSPTGEFVRTIGSPGEGPGELGRPFGFVVAPDGRLLVYDFAKQGLQVFTPEGEFLESVTFDPQEGIPGQEIHATPSGDVLSGGGFRVRMSTDGGIEEPPPGRPIERFGLDGSLGVLYTAWELPEIDETEETRFSTGGGNVSFRMQRTRAFEPGLHIGVLSDGRVAVADSIGYRVKLLDPEGNVTGTVERPIPPLVVDDEIRELERANRLASFAEGGGGGGTAVMAFGRSGGGGARSMSIDREQIRKMQEEQIGSMTFAAEIPVITDMAVDWEDRLWIERYGASPGEDGPTDVVTADGGYLGTIPATGLRIPDAFGPDGLIAFIEEDELEVQRVRVARLPSMEALESGS